MALWGHCTLLCLPTHWALWIPGQPSGQGSGFSWPLRGTWQRLPGLGPISLIQIILSSSIQMAWQGTGGPGGPCFGGAGLDRLELSWETGPGWGDTGLAHQGPEDPSLEGRRGRFLYWLKGHWPLLCPVPSSSQARERVSFYFGRLGWECVKQLTCLDGGVRLRGPFSGPPEQLLGGQSCRGLMSPGLWLVRHPPHDGLSPLLLVS